MKNTIKLLFLSVVTYFFVGCSSYTQVIENPQGEVPQGMTTATVKQSIREALVNRGWVVKSDAQGVITAELNVRSHNAKIRIPYNNKTFSINYVSSANLKAEDGHIHNKYNHWVNNLYEDIKLNFSKHI